MAGNVHELRPKAADSEKITINLGYVDLGHIDLHGAGRVLLQPDRLHPHRHPQPARTARRGGPAIDRAKNAGSRAAALQPRRSRGGPEGWADAGSTLLGLASIAADVTPELARATIGSVSVLGALQASPAVKAALTDRMR